MAVAILYLALVGEYGGDTGTGIFPSLLDQLSGIDQRTCEEVNIAVTEQIQTAIDDYEAKLDEIKDKWDKILDASLCLRQLLRSG